MPYRDTNGTPGQWQTRAANPRQGAQYRAEAADARQRAAHGAPCTFYGRPGHHRCPGAIDLSLPAQHRWAFTAHHPARLMDGGQPVGQHLEPAHRACNAADGLRAQNERRRQPGLRTACGQPDLEQDETTRDW